MTKPFDFDIQPSTTQVSGNILPEGEAEVYFQIRNSGDCLKRAEVILMPTAGPEGLGRTENLADWLQLVEPREYDYQPQSHRNYTAKIKITGSIVPGTYKFRMLVVGHDDPDNEYMESEEVSFNVALRPVKVLPFVIGGIVLLAFLAIGVIIALRSSKPSPALITTLISPKMITVGQPAGYQLKLENTFKETVAKYVVMEYTYPTGILGAWVEWKDENGDQTTPQGITCRSTARRLRCEIEKIEPQEEVDLMIYVLPGPVYTDQYKSVPTKQTSQIDNTGLFTLRWIEKEIDQEDTENGKYYEDLDLAGDHPFITLASINATENPVSGAAIPAVDIATVEEAIKISLIGWNNKERGGPVFFEYELPQGMRFATYPKECEQQIGNFSILHCTAESEVPIDIQVIPLQSSILYVQTLRGNDKKKDYLDLIGIPIAVGSIPSPALAISLKALTRMVTVGQPAVYQLELESTFKETVVENVVLEYDFPEEGILGAWVEWKDENGDQTTPPGISACGSTTQKLRCVFEKIKPQQVANLKIKMLPYPLTSTEPIAPIDNKGRFTLSWLENEKYKKDDLNLAEDDRFITLTPVDVDENPVSGVAIPAVDTATVGLPVKISLVGWNNIERGGPVFYEFELPQGMRFASYPDECEQQTGNYSNLHCTAESEVPIDIQVIPLQPSTGYVLTLRGSDKKEIYRDLRTAGMVPVLPAAINQMVFNGMNEWGQLGYSGLPGTKEFTVEMWVNPHSLEDGQALIGTHRHSQASRTVFNQFLVGYYNGYLNVNVLGECHNLDINPFMVPASPAEEFTALTVKDAIDKGLQKLSLKEDQVDIDILEQKNEVKILWFVLKNPYARVRLTPKLQKTTLKTTEPFHLAIVVKDDPDNNRRDVKVYKDGRQLEAEIISCCPDCKVEPWDKPTGDEVDFNWIIGQDWDSDGSDIVPSDFFRGAISDVRIYAGALTSGQVQEDMYLPPPLFESDKDEQGARLDLIGWWPLAQPSQSAAGEQLECSLPRVGKIKDETVMDTPCMLVDLSLNHLNGARSGGEWENKNTRFSDALAFTGNSILSLPSNFGNDIFLRPAKTPPAATTATLTPTDGSEEPSEPVGVPVTMSAWIYIDAVPSQSQTILAASFTPEDGGRVSFGLGINENGHVQFVYNDNENFTVVEDDKRIPAGLWIHYAVVFWFDKSNGELSKKTIQQMEGEPKEIYLFLFRDGQRVKASPEVFLGDIEFTINGGLNLGGLQKDDNSIIEGFTGRIDEVRIWNRALYNPIGNASYISSEIDFWRRMPGIAFDESVYWSFDDQIDSGTQTIGLCQNTACPPIYLTISGPAWIPNDLSLDYTE